MDEPQFKIPDVCRCCLSQSTNLNNLFQSTDGIDVAQAIQDVCAIDIITESSLFDKICNECLECVKFCYNFRLTTQQSDKTLKNLLEGAIIVKENVEKDQLLSNNQTDFIAHNQDSQSEDEITDDTVDKEPAFTHYVNSIADSDKKCPYCQKDFVHLKNLRTHMQRHFIKGKYNCPHCPNRYHTKFDVQRHMTKVHLDGIFFECDLCEKEFPTRAELTRHLRSHGDLKPFSCVECGMLFRSKDNAQQHILNSHEKKKPLVCEKCGKGFAFPCKLKNHNTSKCKPSVHISIMKDDVMEEEEL